MTRYREFKFPTQAAADAVIYQADPEGGTRFVYPDTFVIGTITHREGDVVIGWHVDIALPNDTVPIGLQQFLIDPPLHPRHTWLEKQSGSLV